MTDAITERGMRLLVGEEAHEIDCVCRVLASFGEAARGQPVHLPTIEPASIYTDKLGDEMDRQVYRVEHPKRDLVLRPEGTATIQAWSRANWDTIANDTALYYVARCFRRERPQAGRYREFTQFGFEVIKPVHYDMRYLQSLALDACEDVVDTTLLRLKPNVRRGLGYYTDGTGFEIECPALGAQKQVAGGGAYAEGMGFAIGVDRLVMAARAGTYSEKSE